MDASSDEAEPAPRTGFARWGLVILGVALTVLATIGAFLPVLPTTPFLIVAAACFARSSPRFHKKLLENRIFGPYISQWENTRTVPPEAKRKAYGLVLLTFGLSIAFVGITWVRVTLAVVGLLLLVFLMSLPTPDAS